MEIIIGQIITEQVADLIKASTTAQDRASVFTSTGVGTSTLRNITYRLNPVTASNVKGVKALLEIALLNTTQKEVSSKKEKKNIVKLLDTI